MARLRIDLSDAKLTPGGALEAPNPAPNLGRPVEPTLLRGLMRRPGFLALVAVLNTSVQLLVAEEVRGRILAIYMMTLTGSYPLGALLQGWLADRIGAPATVLAAGGMLLLTGLVLALRPALPASLDEHTHRRSSVGEEVLAGPAG